MFFIVNARKPNTHFYYKHIQLLPPLPAEMMVNMDT